MTIFQCCSMRIRKSKVSLWILARFRPLKIRCESILHHQSLRPRSAHKLPMKWIQLIFKHLLRPSTLQLPQNFIELKSIFNRMSKTPSHPPNTHFSHLFHPLATKTTETWILHPAPPHLLEFLSFHSIGSMFLAAWDPEHPPPSPSDFLPSQEWFVHSSSFFRYSCMTLADF